MFQINLAISSSLLYDSCQQTVTDTQWSSWHVLNDMFSYRMHVLRHIMSGGWGVNFDTINFFSLTLFIPPCTWSSFHFSILRKHKIQMYQLPKKNNVYFFNHKSLANPMVFSVLIIPLTISVVTYLLNQTVFWRAYWFVGFVGISSLRIKV